MEFSDLLTKDVDIEFYTEDEIEYELSQFSSLIYNINEKQYYAYTLDLNDEDEYYIPINIDDNENIELYDYTITILNKKEFKELVENTVGK